MDNPKKRKPGLWCVCGARIKKGTMLAHWRKFHPTVNIKQETL